MSGGSFNYLCFKSVNELLVYSEDLKDMTDSLKEYGYSDIAEDVKKFILKINEINKIIAETEKHRETLEDVFHTVEWHESGDYSKETMIEVLEKYREARKYNV